MESTRFIGMFEAAFPISPPPDITLHEAHLSDDTMFREISEEEWEQARRRDFGRSWRDISDQDIIECQTALPYFDEKSFVYHLPAFMLFAIRHCAVDILHPYREPLHSVTYFTTNLEPYSLARYKTLSPQQRDAFVEYLEYLLAHGSRFIEDDVRQALDQYWKTSEASKPLIIVP